MDRLIAVNSVPFANADTAPATGTAQYATSGNPVTNTPATIFPAYAWNMLQDEIYNVIIAAGLTPNRNAWNQLLTAIQALLQGRIAKFTSSSTMTAPAATLYLSGCAGGGGGGGNATVGSPNIMSGAGGGGAGQSAIRNKLTVVPGETLTITIGAAGIAGATNTTGGTGGITSIVGSISGTLLTLTGGAGGSPGLGGTFSGYQPGQNGGAGFPNGAYGQDTGPVGIGAIGGVGASGPFGGGAPGGRGTLIGSTMFQGIAAAGFGAGGGGCGGCYPGGNTTIPTTPGNTGGAASPGLAIIEW